MICCGVPRTLPSGPALSKTRLMMLPMLRRWLLLIVVVIGCRCCQACSWNVTCSMVSCREVSAIGGFGGARCQLPCGGHPSSRCVSARVGSAARHVKRIRTSWLDRDRAYRHPWRNDKRKTRPRDRAGARPRPPGPGRRGRDAAPTRAKPAAANSAATAGPCPAPISKSARPPGASTRAEPRRDPPVALEPGRPGGEREPRLPVAHVGRQRLDLRRRDIGRVATRRDRSARRSPVQSAAGTPPGRRRRAAPHCRRHRQRRRLDVGAEPRAPPAIRRAA